MSESECEAEPTGTGVNLTPERYPFQTVGSWRVWELVQAQGFGWFRGIERDGKRPRTPEGL